MAHKENLVKIGQEAFSIVEDFYGGRARAKSECPPDKDPVQKPYPKRRNLPPPKTIDIFQAARKYGGVVIMEGRIKYLA